MSLPRRDIVPVDPARNVHPQAKMWKNLSSTFPMDCVFSAFFRTVLLQSFCRDELSFSERGFCHGFLCEFLL